MCNMRPADDSSARLMHGDKLQECDVSHHGRFDVRLRKSIRSIVLRRVIGGCALPGRAETRLDMTAVDWRRRWMDANLWAVRMGCSRDGTRLAIEGLLLAVQRAESHA